MLAIFQIGLLSDINLHDHPNLAGLLSDSESVDVFTKLTPEQILIRWVNYHLARSPCQRQVSNFTTDIKDSVVYIHLLSQIAPKDAGVTTSAEKVCFTVVQLMLSGVMLLECCRTRSALHLLS